MPSLGADMEDGTLVEWLIKPGQAVKRGDIAAVVETQKGAIEIEIFEDGVVEQLLVKPETTVPVGAPLALIRAPGEAIAAGGPAQPTGIAPAAVEPPAVQPAVLQRQAPAAAATAGQRASPAARRLAAEHGLDLASVTGRGPGGAVTLSDVEAALAIASRPSGRPAGADLGPMRAAIAAAMSRSKREIPHYYLSDTVEIGAAHSFIAARNAELPPDRRLLLGVLFVKATALAALRFPEFSGRFEDGAFHPAPKTHVGVAIAIRGGGLVAPAIHDVAELGLDGLMAQMRDLVSRVRSGRFRSSEIADPTITVSSLGERGVEALWGVIYPPQVAIVGVGKPVDRPWVADGQVVPRSVVTLTLAADHRVSDGHRGALFLAEIGKRLQSPEAL